MITAITGGSFGDEGKGKITDLLAQNADIIVRFQGGANAGHTIINEYGKFVLHLLPSGVFNSHTINIIASGVAFDFDVFLSELEILKSQNITPVIKISSRTQLLLPFHKLQDKLEEKRLGKNSFGSTQSGIAPFYSDKYAKKNIQISELYSENLNDKISRICKDKNIFFKAFYNLDNAVSEKDLREYLSTVKEKLKPFLCDCPYFLNDAINSGKKILLEGQLGSLRDIDNGIYPFVTSSSTLAGYGSVSTGIPPHKIDTIIAVIKAYSTCVGAGAFVGELIGESADELRRRGGDNGEFGATTGRPRRMAWFDCVATRYGCMIQGATQVSLTMLDVLSYLDKIPVCIGYQINGKVTKKFPETHLLEHAIPIYKFLDGWKSDISSVKNYNDLPLEAKYYVDFIESQINVPITMVSNGPNRKQILYRKSALVNKL